MPFVQAKCPNCGGFLAVDNTHDAAVCQFCNTPFIVEKAINNYNITVKGNLNLDNANISVEGAPTIESLLTRAASFIDERRYDRALSYFDRVLDLDPNNKEAQSGIRYLTVPNLENLVIKRERAFSGMLFSFRVYVDNVEVGEVGSGETLYRMIPPGDHVLVFRGGGLFQSYNISLPSALQYVEVNIRPGLTGWIVNGDVYDFVEN